MRTICKQYKNWRPGEVRGESFLVFSVECLVLSVKCLVFGFSGGWWG